MSWKRYTLAKQYWITSWQEINYRRSFIIGFIFLTITLSIISHFFQAIEQREGVLLQDWILAKIPAQDVSIPIFILIWSTVFLLIIRSLQDPQLCITFLWSYILLTLSRLITIGLVPLNPPLDLIPLIDPISNQFYGTKFITKDLFYSGHVSTQFLMFLCFSKRNDKILALCTTIGVSILILIQHVHYTLDVVSAPIFSYIIWTTARKTIIKHALKKSFK